MPTESGVSPWERIKTIVGIGSLAVALLVFALGGGFVYQNLINVPDVLYTVLPIYPLEDQSFGGLVVENRGRATAHDVRIGLGQLATAIEQASVQSDESWRQESGGSGKQTLVLWLDRMTAGSAVTVYLLTERAPYLDDVSVTTEEGPGRLSAVESRVSFQLVLLGAICLLLGCAGFGLSVGYWLFWRRDSEVISYGQHVEYLNSYYQGELSALKRVVKEQASELDDWRTGKRWPPPPSAGNQP